MSILIIFLTGLAKEHRVCLLTESERRRYNQCYRFVVCGIRKRFTSAFDTGGYRSGGALKQHLFDWVNHLSPQDRVSIY
jgi:hypothetical protein